MKKIIEALVELENSEEAVVRAIERLAGDFTAIHRDGADYILEFESTRAVIRPQPSAVWLRVESDEYILCYGTKMLVEARIGEHATGMSEDVLWVEANGDPFAALRSAS